MISKVNQKSGFTLIESLLAIGVLIVGVLSAFILVVRSLSNIPLIQSRLIAANLAQEGIELIRQKRDTNYIQGLDWINGFNDQCICMDNSQLADECYFVIDANSRTLKQYDNDDYLKFNKELGIYSYDTGEILPYFFQRKIEICFPQQNNNKEMRIKETVYWKVKQNNYSLIVEDHLFDYYGLLSSSH
ncbi:MAG TPA: hypothetical protein PLH82_00835 [Candidatus Paceibacterota bacterium]|nr:hypothetical protein [Candidatus Paceibacterota bacterium]